MCGERAGLGWSSDPPVGRLRLPTGGYVRGECAGSPRLAAGLPGGGEE